MVDRSLTVIAPRGVARSFDPGELLDAWRDYLRECVLAGDRQSRCRGMVRALLR
jgi:hypothetical protein